MIELQVDCKARRITLVWRVWADGTVKAQDIAVIRSAVDRFWNPRRKHRYRRCSVAVGLELLTSADTPSRPAGFDWLKIGRPHGSLGSTHQDGPPHPLQNSILVFGRDANGQLQPETVSRELGHAMGIADPAGNRRWDREGIKGKHIEMIVGAATVKTRSGDVLGWGARLDCCAPARRRRSTKTRRRLTRKAKK